jgi:hypothetical protein
MPTKSGDLLQIDRIRCSEGDPTDAALNFREKWWSRFRPPRDCYRPIKKLKKNLKNLLVKKSQKTGLKSIKKLVLEISPLPPQPSCFICNSSAFMSNYVNHAQHVPWVPGRDHQISEIFLSPNQINAGARINYGFR